MKQAIALVLVLVLTMGILAAEVALSEEDTVFLEELAFQLRNRGWDEEELAPLMEQARHMRRDEAPVADPAVIAFALHYGTSDEEGSPGELANMRARLALELAFSTEEMKRLGYGVQAIAQGSALGVAEAVAQLRAEKKSLGDDAPGTQVRTMVREKISQQVALRQKATDRVGLGSMKQIQVKGRPDFAGSSNRPASAGPAR